MGLFISASTMAGAFGGILAFGIQKMEGYVHHRYCDPLEFHLFFQEFTICMAGAGYSC
jgi:hypothetical protein